MLPPVWLDREDAAQLAELQKHLWARSIQDTFLQCLRWCYRQVHVSPSSYRRHLRYSERPFADGVPLVLRLTGEQRECLDEFHELVDADTLADAVRIVVRMAYGHFVEDSSLESQDHIAGAE
jgi:predicted RNA binding protein with dsRBD fold (UPF0201 family)